MRVLIAPDKFKGTLGALEAAEAIARGWRRVRPRDRIDLLPMSDGGDGFGPVLGRLLSARTLSTAVLDAAGRPRRARCWWVPGERIAILETAQANGLALLPPGRFHPFDLDTTGVGQLVGFVLRKRPRRCLLGVGGSATNDGGFGMARHLGWRFLDRDQREILRWTELGRLERLERPPPAPSGCRFVVATDVENPLLGRLGASRVYGPQKGLLPADFPQAEACLRRLARVVRRDLGIESDFPGAGAAGGLGFGLSVFLGAERRLGFEVFSSCARLDEHLRRSDLVITGEGAFDPQSLMGKGVGQLLKRAHALGRWSMVLAGRVSAKRGLPDTVVLARGLCDLVDPSEAQAHPALWLAKLSAAAASSLIDASR